MQKRSLLKIIASTFVGGVFIGVLVTQVGAALRGSAIFRDVPADHFADQAIGDMYALGLIKGKDSAHFDPNAPITRAEATMIFKRLTDKLGLTATSTSSSSSSSSVSSSSSSSTSSSSSSSSSSQAYNPSGYIRFDSNGYMIDENAAVGRVTIGVVRTGGNQGSSTVKYSFSGGTATVDTEYTPLSGTLSFANKETSKKLELIIKDDGATDGNKTVNLKLFDITGGAGLGTPNTAVLTIVDNESPSSSSSSSSSADTTAVFALSAKEYAVMENGASVTITVVRGGVLTGASSVNYATSDGSAKAGNHYTAVSGTLNFAANETSKTFVVQVTNNAVIEGNKSLNLTLSSPGAGGSLGYPATATLSIVDDEASTSGSGTVKFGAATFSVTENDGKAYISIMHAGGGIGAFAVDYAAGPGSAISPADFTAVSGTMQFAAGEVVKVFVVPIVKDSLSDSEETVNLAISNPTKGVQITEPSITTLKIYD